MIPHVSIKNATLSYRDHRVFSELNLDLPAGRWIGLLGASGVGKSSLLRMIAGLPTADETSQGCITADNHLPVSQQIAYMAQMDLLLPWLTVLHNATLGLKLRKQSREAYQAAVQKATTLLAKVGLAKVSHLFPQQLSGGMRQRVALVRTLMEDKPIVLMDEPFSALDTLTRYKLQNLSIELMKNKTVLFITHDPSEALRLAHDIYLMQGCPASLTPIATSDKLPPRPWNDTSNLALYTQLMHELTQTEGKL